MSRTVLLVHGSSTGYGADRQLLALATGLDQRRYRPVVVLPEPGRLGAPLEAAGVETHFLELATLRRDLLSGRGLAVTAARMARNRRLLAELARSRSAAIVHTNTSIVLAGQGAASRAGAAHVVHVREIYNDPRPAAKAMWPLLRRRLLRADSLICVSEVTAGQFPADPRVRVIHDGLAPGPSRMERSAARRALGLPANAAVIAIVGRVSDWKGQRILAEALALEPLASTGAIGIVAGDAAPGQAHFDRELRELRERLRLGDRLRLLGYRDDLETVLGAADVFAAPATHPDALPNAVIEAAAAGVPVVGSEDGGGLPEILSDGVSGRLVPPRDPHALAVALADLLGDPKRARRLASAAAVVVRDRFQLGPMLEAVQACYDELG